VVEGNPAEERCLRVPLRNHHPDLGLAGKDIRSNFELEVLDGPEATRVEYEVAGICPEVVDG
jgi:hypothetical protein